MPGHKANWELRLGRWRKFRNPGNRLAGNSPSSTVRALMTVTRRANRRAGGKRERE